MGIGRVWAKGDRGQTLGWHWWHFWWAPSDYPHTVGPKVGGWLTLKGRGVKGPPTESQQVGVGIAAKGSASTNWSREGHPRTTRHSANPRASQIKPG